MPPFSFRINALLAFIFFNLITFVTNGQQLKLRDFAVWGGKSAANSYNNNQGVFLSSNVKIIGSIGSNHQVQSEKELSVTGNIISGNQVSLSETNKITGNIIAFRKAANCSFDIINAGNGTNIMGDVIANGRIDIKNSYYNKSSISGKVKVPAPTSSNYSGPVPQGGFSNSVELPELPIMPDLTPFDKNSGSVDISSTQIIKPGSYRSMLLKNNKTVTFSGPGNYTFYSIDNSGNNNELVLDFKGTTSGSINIFIVKDANWGKITSRIVNGGTPSRVYTEVHGNGSTNGGNSFDVADGNAKPTGNGVYAWIGTVWAPNGGINFSTTGNSGKNVVAIAGALWSGTRVNLSSNVSVEYTASVVQQNFIAPFYPPPPGGKVAPANNVIGAELLSLNQNTATVSSIPNNTIFQITNNLVLIEVISKVPNDITLLNQLKAAGMTGVVNNGPDAYVITGNFPISQLPALNQNTRIVYVRPAYPPQVNAGQVSSQGDTTMRSVYARSRFGLDGQGVKIGVLSDSYNSKQEAQHDVDEDDLPGIKSTGLPNPNPTPVQVLQDISQKSDEGRAMLQIVHDVAPKARLAFTSGFLSAGNFADGIKALANPNLPGGRCDIIVDDITYITEPFLRDGVVAKTVDEVVAAGVTYFSSAGNFGEKSYENTFKGVPNTSIIPAPATVHQFGTSPTEIYQTLHLKPGSYTIVLQWAEDFSSLGNTTGVQTDLDLYLLNSTGFTLFGFNRSNIFRDPFEVCPFTVTEETEAKLLVVNATGNNSNVRFKYIIFNGDGSIVDYPSGASTIVGHANANSTIAVGAMLYADIPAYTPVYPSVASFSSRGGTFTLTPANTFLPRLKPDIIGPNGVNTTVNLGGPVFNDNDPFPNFFGTSAAAPHVAAVGALILQAKRKYGLQLAVTPAEIRTLLTATAGKFPGQSTPTTFTGGYGFVRADSAVQQIANGRPTIKSWQAVVAGTQPGALPFQVRILGEYLTASTQVYFNGLPVPTTISTDKTTASATISSIAAGQDPPLQLFNSAKSISGIDGGLSEAIHFFSGRADVTVRVVNSSRKFGQVNPAFATEVLVNGVPIQNTNISLATLKLDGTNISFSTLATAYSNAGLYSITPSRSVALSANDPLLLAYGFTFVPGTLTVGKMPIKITPLNQTVKYGDFPAEVQFNYEFDQSQAVSPTFIDQVKSFHTRYMADNALIVVNGFGAQASGLTAADLNGTSAIASFQAVRNARAFSLDNGSLNTAGAGVLPADIGKLRYLIDLSAQSLVNYKINASQSLMVAGLPGENARALLNIKSLANGTAKAAVPNGQLQPMVNGQLLAMVNGQLQAVVNGQLQAVVNGVSLTAADIIFQNGQLLALVNGQWLVATNGQLQAVVNGQNIIVNLSVANGQLQAVVNGQLMAVVNGQLQAVVNGQLLAVVNGQLQAIVNGQLMPVVNGQLLAAVNGQLQPVVNGQLLAVVNGQLMAVVNNELQLVESLTFTNGQLQAVVNGQLQPVVNGQLKAVVNGIITDVPNPTLVNGQLQAVVNGQLQAVVNGQLQPIVNGQLQPIVNGDLVPVSSVKQLSNGQLQAAVNGVNIPLRNGQLQAVVNGQLLAAVNGQLLAVVNGELTFAVFINGQLQAVVNGQLQPVVNGQLRAVVNNQISVVNSYTITNGQLQAVVNGQTLSLLNNQLLSLPNGQLQPVVNNFDVSGSGNNLNTLVLVDEDDINLQGGSLGGMFSVNLVTGLDTGKQTLVAAAFVNPNFDVTYGTGQIQILPRPLVLKAGDIVKTYGSPNPPLSISGYGFSYDASLASITPPLITVDAGTGSGAGQYPVILSGGNAVNYSLILQNGILTINKKALIVTADNKAKNVGQENPPLTITINGLVNGDTKDDICIPSSPKLPKSVHQLEHTSTYTDVKLNNTANKLIVAPGTSVTLTANWNSTIDIDNVTCPGCVTQHYIGLANIFSDCHTVSGSAQLSGAINRSFIAPSVPGIYYITQVSSWEYNCFDRGAGLNYDNNNANDAIAVLVVQINQTDNSIFATTTANTASGAGSYPIIISGCNSANYEVTYNNGQLIVGGAETPSRLESRIVDAPGDVIVKPFLAPNPANSIVRVQASREVAGPGQVIVMDVLGRVQKLKHIRQLTAGSFEIDVSSLPKGLYFVKIKTSGKDETFRFMKI